MKKYSLWTIEHESIYMVMAYKVKDTNSSKKVDKWLDESLDNGASFYREENEVNANYIQLFQNY
jgi:hypothetical protein